MPAVVWSDMRPYRKTLNDTDLSELLSEIEKKTGEEWIIREMPHFRKRFLRKASHTTKYCLYFYIAKTGEWQCINFYKDCSDSSINFLVDKDVMMNFLMGYLSGFVSGKLNETEAPND